MSFLLTIVKLVEVWEICRSPMIETDFMVRFCECFEPLTVRWAENLLGLFCDKSIKLLELLGVVRLREEKEPTDFSAIKYTPGNSQISAPD